MNLILLDPSELTPGGEVTLQGRRAFHLRRVLRVAAGDNVRAGVLGGRQGTARVEAVEADRVTLLCHLAEPGPEPGVDWLLLAFTRPKVMMRCFEHATALGVGNILVFRSRQVEKSQMQSHVVEPTVYERHLRAGLEQSRRTHLPAVRFVPRFTQLLDHWLPALPAGINRFVADPSGETEAALAPMRRAPLALAVGPERGFVEHELAEFQRLGFAVVRAGQQPLRVETALSFLLGQLRANQARAEQCPQAPPPHPRGASNCCASEADSR